MRKVTGIIAVVALLLTSLSLAGCSGNVGVGLSVGIPIGDHGYMSVGGTRWH
jgi:predicted small secreted protein